MYCALWKTVKTRKSVKKKRNNNNTWQSIFRYLSWYSMLLLKIPRFFHQCVYGNTLGGSKISLNYTTWLCKPNTLEPTSEHRNLESIFRWFTSDRVIRADSVSGRRRKHRNFGLYCGRRCVSLTALTAVREVNDPSWVINDLVKF